MTLTKVCGRLNLLVSFKLFLQLVDSVLEEIYLWLHPANGFFECALCNKVQLVGVAVVVIVIQHRELSALNLQLDMQPLPLS